MKDVTQILSAIEQGDPTAADELLPLVYEELHRLAAARMANERTDHTLQATALVNEAFLRLVGAENDGTWRSRGHFFGAAAEAMRRILVEHARKKQAARRGGDLHRVNLSDSGVGYLPLSDNILALHDALDELQRVDEEAAKLVELRHFTGLTIPEVAEILGISPRKANNLWAYARAWLRKKLEG